MPCLCFNERPPESNVIALPTTTIVSNFSIADGVYSRIYAEYGAGYITLDMGENEEINKS